MGMTYDAIAAEYRKKKELRLLSHFLWIND